MAPRLPPPGDIGYRRAADRGRLYPRSQSQGILPPVVLHGPRLSPMRTRSCQRHRNGCSIFEYEAAEEKVGWCAELKRLPYLQAIFCAWEPAFSNGAEKHRV